jgi:hypothetical protein
VGLKTKYYLHWDTTLKKELVANELQRYSFRTNIEHKLNKWLSFGSASLTRTDVSGLNTGRNSFRNMFNAIRQAPNYYLWHYKSYWLQHLLTGNVGQGLNTQPLWNNISNIKYVLDIIKLKLARKEFFLIHLQTSLKAWIIDFKQVVIIRQKVDSYFGIQHTETVEVLMEDYKMLANSLRWNIQNI